VVVVVVVTKTLLGVGEVALHVQLLSLDLVVVGDLSWMTFDLFWYLNKMLLWNTPIINASSADPKKKK
jgi:hypothetical protein